MMMLPDVYLLDLEAWDVFFYYEGKMQFGDVHVTSV